MQVPICRHIKSNGLQCRGAALSESVFCYFHRKLNEGHSLYRSTLVGRRDLLNRGHIIALPAMEDRVAVQLAISEVVNALACNFIDTKRAYALLFGLQLASSNAKGLDIGSHNREVVRECSPAPDILDSVSVDIAPPGLTCEVDDPAAPAEIALPVATEMAPPAAPTAMAPPSAIPAPAPIEIPSPIEPPHFPTTRAATNRQ